MIMPLATLRCVCVNGVYVCMYTELEGEDLDLESVYRVGEQWATKQQRKLDARLMQLEAHGS
jgi:hypothetical protein